METDAKIVMLKRKCWKFYSDFNCTENYNINECRFNCCDDHGKIVEMGKMRIDSQWRHLSTDL